MSPSIRVLHVPSAVGGQPWGLARAEREVGLDSRSVSLEPGPYGIRTDEVLVKSGDNQIVREARRWGLFARALRWADVLHFNFGSTLMPQRVVPTDEARTRHRPSLWWAYNRYASVLEGMDLPLFKRAGKGIVVTFQGDDARQGDVCRSRFAISPADEVEPGYYSPLSDAYKRQRVARFDRYADRIFGLNPDLFHVLPPRARFLAYANVDLRSWRPVPQRGQATGVPLVAHAPSHRRVKGTRHILEAVAHLRAEGVPFDFRLIEGVPLAEARRVYEQADLLVDQLLCGWYGGAAVEFMALGKPVICYIREEDLRFVPPGMRGDLPLIQATPSTIRDVLREWITKDPAERADVGRRSRAFVERWHDPLDVARSLKGHYESILSEGT